MRLMKALRIIKAFFCRVHYFLKADIPLKEKIKYIIEEYYDDEEDEER